MPRRIQRAAAEPETCTCTSGNVCNACEKERETRDAAATAARAKESAEESPLTSPIDWGAVPKEQIKWAKGSAPRRSSRPPSLCGLDDDGNFSDGAGGTWVEPEDVWTAMGDFAPTGDDG